MMLCAADDDVGIEFSTLMTYYLVFCVWLGDSPRRGGLEGNQPGMMTCCRSPPPPAGGGDGGGGGSDNAVDALAFFNIF